MTTTTVYVVHTNTSAAVYCRWAIKSPPGLIHIATVAGTGNLLRGDAVTGVEVTYGMCKVGPIYVAMVTYSGSPNPCDIISVQGDPSANPPGIYMMDCTLPIPIQHQILTCRAAIFNDGTCPCEWPTMPPCVEAEETTWGKVKALYQ